VLLRPVGHIAPNVLRLLRCLPGHWLRPPAMTRSGLL
jgi:hypothetical protein